MTNEKALEILEHNWTGINNPDYTEKELCEVLELAIKAINDIEKIKSIISTHENLLELDVMRYKMICEVIKEGESE